MKKLREFFNPDNMVFRFLGTMGDLIILKLLTFILFVPVITGGAAITSLDKCLGSIIRKEHKYILKPYFQTFREEFKKATCVWLFYLLILISGFLNIQIFGAYAGILKMVCYFFMGFATVFVLYYFAILSRFENTMLGDIKNALVLMVGCLPQTILVIGILAVTIGIVRMFDLSIAMLYVLFLFSLPAFGYMYVFEKIFEKFSASEVE